MIGLTSKARGKMALEGGKKYVLQSLRAICASINAYFFRHSFHLFKTIYLHLSTKYPWTAWLPAVKSGHWKALEDIRHATLDRLSDAIALLLVLVASALGYLPSTLEKGSGKCKSACCSYFGKQRAIFGGEK